MHIDDIDKQIRAMKSLKKSPTIDTNDPICKAEKEERTQEKTKEITIERTTQLAIFHLIDLARILADEIWDTIDSHIIFTVTNIEAHNSLVRCQVKAELSCKAIDCAREYLESLMRSHGDD